MSKHFVMPKESLDYRSPSAIPTRRITPRVVLVPAIVIFGSATAAFVFLGVTWSRKLAVDSRFSANTDGLEASVLLAWTAATLLFGGTCAAVVELIRGRRAPRR